MWDFIKISTDDSINESSKNNLASISYSFHVRSFSFFVCVVRFVFTASVRFRPHAVLSGSRSGLCLRSCRALFMYLDNENSN